jgi:S-formylglutathione hydrolase FrmB
MHLMKLISLIILFLVAVFGVSAQGNSKSNTSTHSEVIAKGTLISDTITSIILKENKVGLETRRNLEVVLPPGYATSKKLYPVVVYLHSIYGKAEWIVSNGAKRLSERAFSKGVTGEFILVIPDCSSSNIGSLYENSPVSGRWLDYITKEVIPFIDKRYRTIRKRESRAVIGDFMGGRGALQLGMSHADLFSVVYAMHPVATGVGPRPWTELGINWQKILKAKTFADLGGDKPCETFVAICQAFLPNPNRPPFYCDYFMKQDSVGLQVDAANMIKIQRAFMLEQRLGESVGNLQKLRALAFDWARNDGNYDHVHSARKFTRDLEDLGIEHEAEEYRGTPWNNTWNDDGRFYMRVLPFLGRHLVFE